MAREKFCFWLNLEKEDEFALADYIFELKQNRSFVTAIRDGLRLICDLRAGRLEILLTLFPWIEETFAQRFAERQSVSEGVLSEQLARLEQLLLEQGNKPVTASSGGPKPLAVSSPSKPRQAEEDEIIVPIKKAKANGNSAQNFLDAAFSLVQ
jgi:hypothetical protein